MDEYFNVAWTKDGQQQALTVMERVKQYFTSRMMILVTSVSTSHMQCYADPSIGPT